MLLGFCLLNTNTPHRGCRWELLDLQDSLLSPASHFVLLCCFLGAQLGVSSCLRKCQKSSPDARRQQPFSGKTFYLDLPAGKTLQFLTEAIQQLGGVCKVLLACDPRVVGQELEKDYTCLPGVFSGIATFFQSNFQYKPLFKIKLIFSPLIRRKTISAHSRNVREHGTAASDNHHFDVFVFSWSLFLFLSFSFTALLRYSSPIWNE